jgi:hypothetical protein
LTTSNLVEFLREGKKKGRRSPLDNVVDAFKSELDTYAQVFVIVDALDECAKQHREHLLERLRSLTADSVVKLLATSRDIPAIREIMDAHAEIKIVAHEPDLRAYVESGVKHIPELRQYLTGELTIEHVVVTIIEKARGMWVLLCLAHRTHSHPV